MNIKSEPTKFIVTDTVFCGNTQSNFWDLIAGDEIGNFTDGGGNMISDECTPDCPADVNQDGVVDVTDVLALIGAWGSSDPLTDINADGTVDVSDLLIVIGNWGPCE